MNVEKAVEEATDYLRRFMLDQDEDEEPCRLCDECKEGIQCREIYENSVENAVEAVWCNANDDKPGEYFSHPDYATLAGLNMEQLGKVLDAAQQLLEIIDA